MTLTWFFKGINLYWILTGLWAAFSIWHTKNWSWLTVVLLCVMAGLQSFVNHYQEETIELYRALNRDHQEVLEENHKAYTRALKTVTAHYDELADAYKELQDGP